MDFINSITMGDVIGALVGILISGGGLISFIRIHI